MIRKRERLLFGLSAGLVLWLLILHVAPPLTEPAWPEGTPTGLADPPNGEGPLRVVVGRVADIAQRGLADARVLAHAPGNRSAPVHTDQDGRFALAGLSAGPWQLEASAPGYRTRSLPLAIEANTPDVLVRHFELDIADTLMVRAVTADGQPLGARLMQLGASRHDIALQVAVGSAPLPRAAPPTPGFLATPLAEEHAVVGTISNPGPGDTVGLYLAGRLLVATARPPHDAPVEFTVGEMELAPHQAYYRLVVHDAHTDAPLSQARATLHDAAGARVTTTAATDAGRLEIAALPPASWTTAIAADEGPSPVEWWLHVTAPGHELRRFLLRPRRGASRDLGIVDLGAPRTLHGVVVGIDGHPTRAKITCFELDRPDAVPNAEDPPSTESNADGSYSLRGLGARRYAIRAETARGVATAVVTPEVAHRGLRLQLDSSSLLHLRPRRSAELVVHDPRTGVPRRCFVRAGSDHTIALARGDHDLTLRFTDGSATTVPVRIGSAAVTLPLP